MDRGSEFLQIDGIKNDFAGRLAWTQKTLRGIPAKCALINNKVRHRAKPAHRTIIAFDILARPCGIGDAILVPDDRNLVPLASFQEIFGEGGMSAADKIQEVKRAFIALESVAKMNELDRTSMQEANRHSTSRQKKERDVGLDYDGQPRGFGHAPGAPAERGLRALPDGRRLDAFQFCFDNLLDRFGEIGPRAPSRSCTQFLSRNSTFFDIPREGGTMDDL